MTALPSIRRTFTPEEYLLIERHATYRSEFLDGEIYAMAGGTIEHNTIIDNLTIEIGVRLKGTDCQVISQDMKVDTWSGGLYSYPDLLIVCGEKRFLDTEKDVLVNPVVLIEVTSQSTENYDRTTKFTRYKRIGTLREYIIVSQVAPHIDTLVLGPNGQWTESAVAGIHSDLSISSVSMTIPLQDIYDRLTFSAV